jgi:magnesium transporter
MRKKLQQRHARQLRRRQRVRVGHEPGTLLPPPGARPPEVEAICYAPDRAAEFRIRDPAELSALLPQWPVTWVNVEGLGDPQLVERLGQVFGLHPLALEDVLNLHQRAKLEEYESHYFIVVRMLRGGPPVDTEQLSIFLGRNFIITFQTGHPGDCFDPLRQRLRAGRGNIRLHGSDYLAYALLDAVIDASFPVLEDIGERLERLENAILAAPRRGSLIALHECKRDLLTVRRAVWPLRDVLNVLVRDDSPLVRPETRIFLRDCYDHAVRLIDLVETDRELGSDLIELYLSSVSNRLNEVMKTLTIITVFFMPLSFIAGVYGMNFDASVSPLNMPELKWYLGYPFALLLMGAVVIAFWIYFIRLGWIGRAARDFEDVPPARPEEPPRPSALQDADPPPARPPNGPAPPPGRPDPPRRSG